MRGIRLWLLLLGVMAMLGLPGVIAKGRKERVDIGPSHSARQARPGMLGVSGGNINDRSGNLVSGGTLGAVVHDSRGNLYILGNSHVLGCLNKAKCGDLIIQPSLVDEDTSGSQIKADAVAQLTRYTKILVNKGKSRPPNLADAAIAAIIPGKVRADGYIMDIGVPSAKTLKAKPGKPVRKSGRATGLTQSTIAATEVGVDVSFANNSVSRFKKQILIDSGSFAGAGDGGALVVDDVANSPRVVGLLFAGNSSFVLATPIDEVMRQLKVSLGGVKTGKSLMEGVADPWKEKTAQDYAVELAGTVKERFDEKLMAIDNVVGNGISLDRSGRPVIEVYLKKDQKLTRAKIPSRLQGIPTRVVVTGAFKSF